MKLITWNIQWCLGVDGRVDPGRIGRFERAEEELSQGGPPVRGESIVGPASRTVQDPRLDPIGS